GPHPSPDRRGRWPGGGLPASAGSSALLRSVSHDLSRVARYARGGIGEAPQSFPYIRSGTVLLERDAELAALDGLVAAGDGRLLLVEGSPGIGKTRLVAEARDRAADAGMRCLSARGCDMERAFSFGVVRQLFEPLVARLDEAERAELFSGAAGLAWQLLSETEGASGGAFS